MSDDDELTAGKAGCGALRQSTKRYDPRRIIVATDRLRGKLNEAHVAKLMQSISAIGLMHPITVMLRPVKTNEVMIPTLVDGWHRLEAVIRLNLPVVETVPMANADMARLWAAAENLHRLDLTAPQRRQHEAAWAAIAGVKSVPSRAAQVAAVASLSARRGGQSSADGNLAVLIKAWDRSAASARAAFTSIIGMAVAP